MKGDFTRDTFEPLKHFSRVLMQQGRVTLDADANEQAAILLRYVRKLARDIIGPYAAPAGVDGGFQLKADPDGGFTIGKGCYYVDGILVENDGDKFTYKRQPDYPLPADDALLAALERSSGETFLIYLDVWERHITTIEDNSIRETALGGPDTCTRAKVVWQVKALPLSAALSEKVDALMKKISDRFDSGCASRIELQKKFNATEDAAGQLALFKQIRTLDEQLDRLNRYSLLPVHQLVLSQLTSLSQARLAARVDPGLRIEDACVTAPASKYRGLENQLYRVEIHDGGTVGGETPPPTFKWSRDNGSIATAWLDTNGNDLVVASTRGFAAGNWVELSDDHSELLGKPGTLVKLAKVEGGVLTVDPSLPPPPRSDYPVNPKVRRWDQVQTENPNAKFLGGVVKIQEAAAGAELWIDLEDGVQIQFAAGGEYRSGDYWLIPARVATGRLEWPMADELNPQPLPPRGIEHHCAVLGALTWANQKPQIENHRCEFWPLLSCVEQRTVLDVNRDVVRPIVDRLPTNEVTPVKIAKPKKRPVK